MTTQGKPQKITFDLNISTALKTLFSVRQIKLLVAGWCLYFNTVKLQHFESSIIHFAHGFHKEANLSIRGFSLQNVVLHMIDNYLNVMVLVVLECKKTVSRFSY